MTDWPGSPERYPPENSSESMARTDGARRTLTTNELKPARGTVQDGWRQRTREPKTPQTDRKVEERDQRWVNAKMASIINSRK
jgi:hypothetical protein